MVVLLIILSGFFSCAETALMSLNRYRLRHKARMKKRSAVLILKLLKRPDRLLGTILIGNTVANIFASALTTLLAIQFFGDTGVAMVTGVLTLAILIFSEVAPKTLAALYPEKTANIVAWPVQLLLRLFYPLVWLINAVANGLLLLLRVKITKDSIEPLSREELRSVVFEGAGKIPHRYQSMLLGILDLNTVTVEEVMIPWHEIVGIDLDQKWENIEQQLMHHQHDWIPIYRESINKIMGVLHTRELIPALLVGKLTLETLVKFIHEPYFIPKGTLLNVQLHNFQLNNQRMALVVDEYGEILGLLTLKDILEEIVGEFATNMTVTNKMIKAQSDGSYLVNGAVTIRELNRVTHWNFPAGGPRTLNGLIIEHLETIPKAGIGIKIADYPIEIIEVKVNRVKLARIFPRLVSVKE